MFYKCSGKTKDNNLKYLSKQNNSMKNYLQSLSVKLDQMIYKSTRSPRKMLKISVENGNKKKNNYDRQILVKKEEIKNKQKYINILKKENEKLTNMFKLVDNTSSSGGSKDRTKLEEINLEILDLQSKLKNYKLISTEHLKCEQKKERLQEMILMNKHEISNTKKEIVEKDNKKIKLNTDINKFEDALKILEENKAKKKLKLKQKQKQKYNILTSDGNVSKEILPLIKGSKHQNKMYINTTTSSNVNIKNQMLKNKSKKIIYSILQ